MRLPGLSAFTTLMPAEPIAMGLIPKSVTPIGRHANQWFFRLIRIASPAGERADAIGEEGETGEATRKAAGRKPSGL